MGWETYGENPILGGPRDDDRYLACRHPQLTANFLYFDGHVGPNQPEDIWEDTMGNPAETSAIARAHWDPTGVYNAP